MSQLLQIETDIYKPYFDENTDKYIDKSPYKPYERNCIRFECRCKAGSVFIGNAMFKQHVKSKTHRDFIKNYKKYYKEIDEASETIKRLTADNELLQRKNLKLSKQVEDLLSMIQELNDDSQFEDCKN